MRIPKFLTRPARPGDWLPGHIALLQEPDSAGGIKQHRVTVIAASRNSVEVWIDGKDTRARFPMIISLRYDSKRKRWLRPDRPDASKSPFQNLWIIPRRAGDPND